MEKLDTSPEEEAIKDKARQFMSDLVPSSAAPPADAEAATTPTKEGADKIAAWKSAYNQHKDDQAALMEQFWSLYDPTTTSIWTMVYDEADSNEDLAQTKDIVSSLLKQTEAIKEQCFSVVHILDSLEIEGVWLFNGPDPEQLYGAAADSSWFTFSQLGPEATDLVQKAVATILVPTNKTLNGKAIQDTQVFC